MQSDSRHHDATLYQAWAWYEKNKKQVLYGAIGLLAVGLIIFFFAWRNKENQDAASAALSKAFAAQMLAGDANANLSGLQSVSAQFPGTKAAIRAQLMIATALFSEGKYSEAQAAFQKFMQEHADSPLVAQALLGTASCLEAQGKTNDALMAYESVRTRHALENVAPQAKFAIARINQGQNKLKEALQLYEDLNREAPGTSIGSESGGLAEDIKAKHPELIPPRIMPTNLPPAAAVPPAVSQPVPSPATNSVPKK